MTTLGNYSWLAEENGHPVMLFQGIALLGTRENAGAADNPIIIAWAHEVGRPDYKHDETAWCGLFMALCAKRAGWEFDPSRNCLWARNWLGWGVEPSLAMLGDVLVFERGTGGHVGQYVGEDHDSFHVLGGNQSDRVSIARVKRSRLLGKRRALWHVVQPAQVRQIFLNEDGTRK